MKRHRHLKKKQRIEQVAQVDEIPQSNSDFLEEKWSVEKYIDEVLKEISLENEELEGAFFSLICCSLHINDQGGDVKFDLYSPPRCLSIQKEM